MSRRCADGRADFLRQMIADSRLQRRRPSLCVVRRELADLAATAGVTLLDWFVVFGTTAFSVAEVAPLPAQW